MNDYIYVGTEPILSIEIEDVESSKDVNEDE